MRKQDDDFAQLMYQTSRRTFTSNLKSALEARDAWHQDKVWRGVGLGRHGALSLSLILRLSNHLSMIIDVVRFHLYAFP